jgi:hypothetical protein
MVDTGMERSGRPTKIRITDIIIISIILASFVLSPLVFKPQGNQQINIQTGLPEKAVQELKDLLKP